MDKTRIVNEIKRTAKANGGKPLGMTRFQHETGICRSDWHGKYWARWGDALTEAGFEPNKLQGAYDEQSVVKHMVAFIREHGKYPVMAELRMKARDDKSFPSHNVFSRIGRKSELARKIIAYCEGQGDFDDVIEICRPLTEDSHPTKPTVSDKPEVVEGYVYLIKSGRFYKIGRTKDPGLREYQLKIQLPEKPKTIHLIKTDDPSGIEKYWHMRFQDRRKEGEWFDLSPDDVTAFKRRRFQ